MTDAERTLAGDLKALQNQLRLAHIEIHGLLTGGPRFGGRVLQRAAERLYQGDWHPGLKTFEPRIRATAIRVLGVRSRLANERNPLQNPNVRAAMHHACTVLEEFEIHLREWGRVPR